MNRPLFCLKQQKKGCQWKTLAYCLKNFMLLFLFVNFLFFVVLSPTAMWTSEFDKHRPSRTLRWHFLVSNWSSVREGCSSLSHPIIFIGGIKTSPPCDQMMHNIDSFIWLCYSWTPPPPDTVEESRRFARIYKLPRLSELNTVERQ